MENKEKIIAEFKIQGISYKDQYIEEYFQCLLCGNDLVYTHKTDFIYQIVEEKAQCPHCKIESKQHCHKLQ
jgi:transcription initiation factor IIE alpha subunit